MYEPPAPMDVNRRVKFRAISEPLVSTLRKRVEVTEAFRTRAHVKRKRGCFVLREGRGRRVYLFRRRD